MKIHYKVQSLYLLIAVSNGPLPTLLEITRLMKKKSLPYSKLLEYRVIFYYPTLPYSVLKNPYSS